MLDKAKDRWAAIGEAAGVRKYVIGVIIAAILGAMDWIEKWAQGLFADWLALKTQVKDLEMVFGFPSWVVGLTVLFALLWWWMLEYAVRLRRQLNPEIAITFEGTDPWVHPVLARTPSRDDPNTAVETTAIFVRFQVKNTTLGTVVRSCEAYLSSVWWKSGSGDFVKVSSGDSMRLRWAAQPPQLSFGAISIPYGVDVFCDLLSVDEEHGQILIKWIVELNANAGIFGRIGTYRFDVVAISRDGGPVNQSIYVDWQGQWDQIRTWAD